MAACVLLGWGEQRPSWPHGEPAGCNTWVLRGCVLAAVCTLRCCLGLTPCRPEARCESPAARPLPLPAQVFDAGSRTLLRQFKGHRAPVHVARFATDQLHVISGGDDGLVALWDVTSGQQVQAGSRPCCCHLPLLQVLLLLPLLLLPLPDPRP